MGIPTWLWRKNGPKQNLAPRWHVLPTRIDFKAGDRALAEGLAEGMRALEQIRRGRGRRLRVEGMYLPLWQAEWNRHRWREAARFQLAPRLWRSLRAAA